MPELAAWASGLEGETVANAVDERLGSIDLWLKELAKGPEPAFALRASDEAEGLSFACIEKRSADLAAGMQEVGIARGDAVALWLPNSPLWMVVHFAAARIGVLTIPINTWSRDSEVSHLLRRGRCKAIFVDWTFRNLDFAGVLDRALSGMAGDIPLKWVFTAGRAQGGPAFPGIEQLSLDEIENLGAGRSKSHSEASPADAPVIAFSTSGTTSLPKLALHAQGPLIAHAEAIARRAGITAADTVLAALPPCGAYGYCLILAAMAAGCRAMHCKEFTIDLAIELIRSEGVTVLALTEPIFRKLFDHPLASRECFQSLRLAFSAGATLEPVVTRAEQEFGFRLTNVYGSSEILALAAFWGPAETIAERSMAGGHLTSDGMLVRAVDDKGTVVRPGTAGELQFRGPIVTSGYLGNPEATRAAFTPDGWYRSQDLGQVRDAEGRSFHYLARLGDAMRVKGFLVHPGEIEEMLQKHPDVAAAQVVGVPARDGEDLPVAFVILSPGAEASPELLRAFCHDHMASYKVPAMLQVVDAFPMTKSANGDKVVKARLREWAKDLVGNG